MKPEFQDRGTISLNACEEIDYLHMILFQVTPAELIDVEFIKPKHSKMLKIKCFASQEDESYWWPTGSSQKHYIKSYSYELVPQVCCLC